MYVIFVDVDEPWPLEIYDRQGNAVNVTMEPGDMVLYGKFYGDKVLIVMISNINFCHVLISHFSSLQRKNR